MPKAAVRGVKKPILKFKEKKKRRSGEKVMIINAIVIDFETFNGFGIIIIVVIQKPLCILTVEDD